MIMNAKVTMKMKVMEGQAVMKIWVTVKVILKMKVEVTKYCAAED